MSPSHAVKSAKRYRYYVSQAIVQQRPEEAGSLPRLPAAEIEGVVSNTLKDLLRSNDQLARLDPSLSAIEVEQLIRQRAADLSDRLDNDHTLLRRLVNKVTVGAKDVVRGNGYSRCSLRNWKSTTRGEPLKRPDGSGSGSTAAMPRRDETRLGRAIYARGEPGTGQGGCPRL